MTPRTPSRAVTALWALAGVAASLYYFTWLLSPAHVGVVALFALLVIADLFNGFQAFTFWATCLRRPKSRPSKMPDNPRVDVLIPTYNEPVDVLEPTVRGALAMTGARIRVLVLDDGDRLDVARMAQRLGARYVARTEHAGAKAGNVNHALKVIEGDGAEYVCLFDSDHVPHRDFLQRTLGLFVDPKVGLVQTPQVYVNTEMGPLTQASAEQQAIFFGPICNGRDGYNSSFCCGTNFVARREALMRAGGFPEDSITEDIVLSTTLVGLGYEIAYVGEALSGGLGPEDSHSYVSQQTRWATGCLELLFKRRSLWKPLSWTQRWQYFAATSYWLMGWTVLVYVSLPVVRLLFGWQPVDDSGATFAVHFLPYFLISVVNLSRFTAGGYSLRGLAMNWGSFHIQVRSTIRVLVGQRIGFAVTPKRAVSGRAWRGLAPNLVVAGILIGAATYGIARGVNAASFNNAMFALVDAALVVSIVGFAQMQSRRPQAATTAEPQITPLVGNPAAAVGVAPDGREDGRIEVAPREVPTGVAAGS